MEVALDRVGKRFNREWIFREVTHLFTPDEPTVILGGNGSGKSTLLKLLAGYVRPSEGNLTYTNASTEVPTEHVFRYISYVAPYLNLYEDLRLEEALAFHFQFKSLRPGLTLDQLSERLYLENAGTKPIREFSSGMKQRVKLGLAIWSDTPLLFLDEPCSNLDQRGKDWYANLITEHSGNRTVIVCSNAQEEEYRFCRAQLEIERYK